MNEGQKKHFCNIIIIQTLTTIKINRKNNTHRGKSDIKASKSNTWKTYPEKHCKPSLKLLKLVGKARAPMLSVKMRYTNSLLYRSNPNEVRLGFMMRIPKTKEEVTLVLRLKIEILCHLSNNDCALLIF